MASWFSEGYDLVDQEAKRLEEMMNRSFIPIFKLKDQEDAKIIFLTDTPLTFYEHYVGNRRNGRTFTCPQDGNCPICDMGNKPSFRGAYLVLDTRYEKFTRSNGEVVEQQHTIKVMKHGIKTLKQIKMLKEKRGLFKYGWEVTRTGEETDTSYSFLPVDLKELVDLVGDKMPTKEDVAKAKETLMESLKPKDRQAVLDYLSGRNGGNNNASSTPSTATPNLNPDINTEDDGPILKFL